MRNVFLLSMMVLSTNCYGASVRAEVPCPTEPLESCRWDIRSQFEAGTVRIEWEKSLLSRRREKPLASPLSCNVDRDFDRTAGGYIRVWFRNETLPCDPMRRNPADCGVTFLLDSPGVMESARGFTVTAPPGRVLERVEHYSTLHLQCGDFRAPGYARRNWRARVGWSVGRPGDGTYSENAAPTTP